METDANLVTGRLGFISSDTRAQPPAAPEARGSTYKASRLGLLAPSQAAAGERTLEVPERKLLAAKRSARMGWAAAAALVIACGVGSYLSTSKLIAWRCKFDRVNANVSRHVASIGRLQGQRDTLNANLSATRTDLEAIKAETADVTAKLRASVAGLVDAVRQRDEAKNRARQTAEEAAKIQAQMTALEERLGDLMAERSRLKTALAIAKTKKPGAITQTIETSQQLDSVLSKLEADIRRLIQTLDSHRDNPKRIGVLKPQPEGE